MKSIASFISNKIFESKEDVQRFKIDDLDQELETNKVSKTRRKEIKNFFNTILGPGPYYCISTNNIEGKKTVNRVNKSDFNLLNVLEYPEDKREQNINKIINSDYLEIDNKYLNVTDLTRYLLHYNFEQINYPFELSDLWLFGTYKKKHLTSDERHQMYKSIIQNILNDPKNKEKLQHQIKDYSYDKDEIIKNLKSKEDEEYNSEFEYVKSKNEEIKKHNDKILSISKELKEKFDKLHQETYSLEVNKFKFGYSGVKTWLMAGVAEYNGDYIKVIIQDREETGYHEWGKDLTTLYVSCKDID